jgi:chitinase
MNLRQKNPNLKILISIGGWFAKSTPFNRILANANSRNTFIQNALNFIAHHKFDGIDLQWEYPGSIESGASADSKQKFTSLVKVTKYSSYYKYFS